SFTRPGAELQEDALAEWRFTERGTGSDSFGLEVSDIDATVAHLRTTGSALSPETPMTYDPDGPGPLPAQPSDWRTVGFQHPPLASSDFFFIQYAPERMSPARQADHDVFVRHPNGAQRISAIWLLTRDPDADAARLRRIGFVEAGAV